MKDTYFDEKAEELVKLARDGKLSQHSARVFLKQLAKDQRHASAEAISLGRGQWELDDLGPVLEYCFDLCHQTVMNS